MSTRPEVTDDTDQADQHDSPAGETELLTRDAGDRGRGRLDPRRLTDPIRSNWSRMPLRARLVAIMLVLLVISLAVTGLGTRVVLRDYLVGQVDADLARNAGGVVQQAARSNWPAGDDGQGPPTDYYVQYSKDDGTVVKVSKASRLTADDAPEVPVWTAAVADSHQSRPFTVSSADGAQWRVVVLPITYLADGSSGSVAVALPLGRASAAVAKLGLYILLFGLALTAACAVLGWLAVRRALTPLVEVEKTAAAIAAGDLSQRVPDHPASTEVGRLTTSLNGMLAQIESAFRSREASESRTRRFAADASHELRTPVASIRGFAELYRQGAVREPDDVARTMGRIEDEARRMGGLVEDLLVLARLDEQRPVRAEPVDLLVLAGDATHDARGLASDRKVALVGLAGNQGPGSAVVTGDDARLRQVVSNLLANAVRHTPAGTPIEVAVGTEGATAVLEVRDHGAGLAPEHAIKVFERFYRVDASRARGQGGGSGLGLSIVAAVISAHGGRVGVARTPGGGATFRVEVPLLSTAAAQVAPDTVSS